MSRLSEIGMKLTVPFNHDPDLLDRLAPFAADIDSVYFPPPPDVTGSGRPWKGPSAESYGKGLGGLIEEILRFGAAPELLLNSIIPDPAGRRRILDFTADAMTAGVKRATVADLQLAMALRGRFPDLKITASCIAFIHNAVRARYWRDFAAADRVIVDPSINKSLTRIRGIADLGFEIGLMPANSCMPWCPFQVQHYYMNSRGMTGEDGCAPPDAVCRPYRYSPDNAWRQIACEVVPADIPRYAGLVSIVKLTDRRSITDVILERVEAYTALESRVHPDFRYTDPPETFDIVASCHRECERCLRCREIFLRANPDYRDRIPDPRD